MKVCYFASISPSFAPNFAVRNFALSFELLLGVQELGIPIFTCSLYYCVGHGVMAHDAVNVMMVRFVSQIDPCLVTKSAPKDVYCDCTQGQSLEVCNIPVRLTGRDPPTGTKQELCWPASFCHVCKHAKGTSVSKTHGCKVNQSHRPPTVKQ